MIGRLAIGIGGAFAAALLAARWALPRLLYPVPQAPGACPEDARLHTLRAADGTPVHAVEVACPAGTSPRATVVYLHGNGETAADRVPLARMLADEGLRVLLVEYRGYGPSRAVGPPNEEGLYADASAACELVAGEPLVLWGTSLGAAVAVEMARRFRPRALVLVCPFTSVRDLCRRFAPMFPAGVIVRDAFDSAAKAGELDVPTLIVHGEEDRLVPAAMGRSLAARIRGARFLGLAGAGHDVFPTHGDDVVRAALAHVDAALGGAPHGA